MAIAIVRGDERGAEERGDGKKRRGTVKDKRFIKFGG
jgi:hypothetical protein